MLQHRQLPQLPLELLDAIFEQLSEHAHAESFEADTDMANMYNAKTALARSARACRAFHEPALRVLWRKQRLGRACSAVLSRFDFGSVKWPEQEDETWGGGTESDDEANDDMAVGIDSCHYPFNYSYLPGPVAAEEWSRFEYYAQFVRVLRYSTDETIDPSVFFFLQQHARGKPLFPNLHQLVWEHATPELVSVITPSIRVLHLPQDYAEMENGSQSYEYGYRMRRHAFKQLLRGVLERLPDLAELTLPVLGHEAFWFPLLSRPDNHFVTQGIHTLHLFESHRALMRAGLAALSTIRALTELDIMLDSRGSYDPANMDDGRNVLLPIGVFAGLKRLQIDGRTVWVRAVFRAIVAPKLEAVVLACGTWLDSQDTAAALEENHLCAIFSDLRRRNAVFMQKLHLTIPHYSGVLFPKGTTPDTHFASLAIPLAELSHLRDVMISQPNLDGDHYLSISVPALVAAWPALQTLALPDLFVTGEALEIISRTCALLERLTVRTLSWSRSNVPGISQGIPFRSYALVSDANKSMLEELRFGEHVHGVSAEAVGDIAYLLDSLFPQLVPGRCSVTVDIKRDAISFDVMDEVAKLQQARRSG